MIYLLAAVGFPLGGSGRKNCKQIANKQLYTWGKRTQNNTKTQNTQNIKQIVQNKIIKNLKIHITSVHL